MSYRSARVGRLVLIRWLRPDESDIEPVLAELRRARAELDGRPPIIVAIMPDDSDTPSLATGRAMASRLDDTFEIVEGIHSIIEGSSVRAIAKRLAFEAIVSVTAHRRRSFVWRSLDELIMRLGPAAIEASRTDVHATAARLFRDPAARAAP
jgi:hypothetical protein